MDTHGRDPLQALVAEPRRERIDSLLERLDTHGVGRRQFIKLVGASAAALAAGRSFVAPGGVRAATASDGKIALLSWAQGNEYGVQWGKGHLGAAKQLGLKSVVLDGRWDAGVQANQFDQQVLQGAAGIVIGANDPTAIPTLARSANQHKILFADAWNQPPWYTPWDAGAYYDAYLVPDDTIAVAKTIDLLAKAINGKGTVVRVAGIKGATAENLGYAGTLAGLKKHPQLKLAGQIYGQYNPATSQKVTASLLTRYPDTVGVIAVDDDAALGVIAAIRAAGKTPGKDIFVIGTDATKQGVQNVASGAQLATTGSTPTYPGYLTVTRFYDRLHGWSPKEAERMVGWTSVIVTKQNASAYKARFVDTPEDAHFSATLLSRVKSPKSWDLQFGAYPIEDIGSVWPTTPRPANYKYPAAYTQAKKAGEFDQIRRLYAAHFKVPVLGPSPVKG